MLPLVMFLSACVTEVSSVRCPSLVAYDQATLNAVAAELATLPRGSQIERLLSDYAMTRDEARACLEIVANGNE